LKRPLSIAIVVIVVALVIIAIYPRPQDGPMEPEDSVPLPERGYYMGVLPTPSQDQTFQEAYLESSGSCEFSPVWGRPTPFYEMVDDLGGSWGETFVRGCIRGNGMFPLIQFSFFGTGVTLVTPPGMEGATLSDQEWRNAYRDAIMGALEETRPAYISLGNEVNRWYEEHGMEEGDPDGFQHYVSLYNEIYDQVKQRSHDTRVFCTFAREIVSELREADMSVLGLFDVERMDMLVITSYPHSVQGINRPSDLTEGYYDDLSLLMPGIPFGFSEVAWPSLEAFGGQQAQAGFLANLTSMTSTMDLRMLGWPWLHDIDANDHTGLLAMNGEEKLAYQVWLELSSGVSA
jgi:hypothetical protein